MFIKFVNNFVTGNIMWL